MDTNPPAASGAQPKKFVRTFAGDMETLKRGGTPDLAPFQKAPAAVPALPTAPISPTVPPKPAGAPPPSATPLKTYEGDFLERMNKTRASTATVLAVEQDAARAPQAAPKESSRRNVLYGIAGGLLVLAGGIGMYFAYARYLAVSEPVMLAPVAASPIFVDEREEISGSGAALAQAIRQSAARRIASGAVRILYLQTATTSVFSALQLPAPDALLRNVRATPGMAGVVHVSGTQSSFFILSVATFGDTFAALLSWEPRMPRDLAAVFPPFTESSGGQTASSTAARIRSS